MNTGALWMQLLTMLGYLLPEIVACGIGFALLSTAARPGPARQRGRLGMALVSATVLLHAVIGVYQIWLFANAGGGAGLSTLMSALGVARFLINCVFAIGLVLIVQALCQATRSGDALPPPL